ncbi:MAG: CaiB/BaiF CoA transferase family protein [Steroidobacteraceae bacterium]
MNTALLAGMTVLDLSRLLPGPLATWHLASLGARVVKVESPGAADYEKRIGPADGHTSFLHRQLNVDKEIVGLDLTRVEGQSEFLGRVRQADLVVESFRPGVLERMGLGFDRLRELNPRVCLVSISGYGARGAMACVAGHDLNFLALSGWLHELLPGEGLAVPPNVQIGDLLAGALSAAFAAVSALLHAARSGTGTHLDVSMTAVLASSNLLPLAYAQAGRASPAPGCDLLNGGLPCYALYGTRDDRYLAVAALESKFWLRFCDVLGRPDLSTRHWQSGQEAGSDDARAVRDELTRLFSEQPLSHWTNVFAGADCCVTPVLRMDEVLEHPVSAEYLTSKPAGEGGSIRSLRSGVRVLG